MSTTKSGSDKMFQKSKLFPQITLFIQLLKGDVKNVKFSLSWRWSCLSHTSHLRFCNVCRQYFSELALSSIIFCTQFRSSSKQAPFCTFHRCLLPFQSHCRLRGPATTHCISSMLCLFRRLVELIVCCCEHFLCGIFCKSSVHKPKKVFNADVPAKVVQFSMYDGRVDYNLAWMNIQYIFFTNYAKRVSSNMC